VHSVEMQTTTKPKCHAKSHTSVLAILLYFPMLYRFLSKYKSDVFLLLHIHRVSKNVQPLACYNFDAHEWILIFFGINVANKVDNQKTLYYATSSNLCFCTTRQNAETRKSHISLNWIVLPTQCTCALSS